MHRVLPSHRTGTIAQRREAPYSTAPCGSYSVTHIVKQLEKKQFLVSNMLAWEGATFRKAFVQFKIAGKSICSCKNYSKEFVDGASTHANLAEKHFFVSKSAENPFFMREAFWFLRCTCFLRTSTAEGQHSNWRDNGPARPSSVSACCANGFRDDILSWVIHLG